MDDDVRERIRENATSIASTIVTGFWLAALLTGQSWWLGALIIGYVVVVPLVALLYGDEADRREWWDDWWGDEEEESVDESPASPSTTRPETTNNRDALETLRARYAAGELTDEQFERKLELLLETDTIENADEWTRERRGESSRERDYEYET